jgi:hypothetical protein
MPVHFDLLKWVQDLKLVTYFYCMTCMTFYFQCTTITVVSITFLSDIFEKELQKGH